MSRSAIRGASGRAPSARAARAAAGVVGVSAGAAADAGSGALVIARGVGSRLVADSHLHALLEELCERIEKAVSRFSLHVRGGKHARVGISVGAASYGLRGETLDQLLIAADEAMYAIKSVHKLQTRTAALKAEKVADLNTGDLASTAIN